MRHRGGVPSDFGMLEAGGCDAPASVVAFSVASGCVMLRREQVLRLSVSLIAIHSVLGVRLADAQDLTTAPGETAPVIVTPPITVTTEKLKPTRRTTQAPKVAAKPGPTQIGRA